MLQKNNIVILGAQGSGKGTQSKLLVDKYGLQHFETGGILRKIAQEDTELGRAIDTIINKQGESVPWSMLEKILETGASRWDQSLGVVFDGTPRRMEEVLFWEKQLPKLGRKFDFVFYITLSQQESVQRISNRRLCRQNKHSLIFGKDVQSETDSCPICGSEIFQREDDTPEKVLNRLQWNEKMLTPVVEYYKNQQNLIEIDGVDSIDNVFQQICSYIEVI